MATKALLFKSLQGTLKCLIAGGKARLNRKLMVGDMWSLYSLDIEYKFEFNMFC